MHRHLQDHIQNDSEPSEIDIISPYHSAFVLGRSITDNVILGFECVHSLKARQTEKT